jgi:hypothetical protein
MRRDGGERREEFSSKEYKNKIFFRSIARVNLKSKKERRQVTRQKKKHPLLARARLFCAHVVVFIHVFIFIHTWRRVER